MEFKKIENCISCDSVNKRKKFSYVGFQNITFNCFKCEKCGLLYASPLPVLSDSSIEEIYSSDYYTNYFGNEKDYLNEKSLSNITIKKELKKEFELFSEFINTGNSSKKVLDVGCGDGRFLELFREQSWECHGIEPSVVAREIAHKNGFQIFKSFLKLNSGIASYDCIIMDNVIEHLDNPNLYLEKLYELLNEGGIAVLKTPNSTSLFEVLERTFLFLVPGFITQFVMNLLKRKFNIGSGTIHRYGNLHPPVHLAIFNEMSITRALTNANFNINNIHVYKGSEYYYKWCAEETKPSTFLGSIIKLIKQLGDFSGKGDRLFIIARKN